MRQRPMFVCEDNNCGCQFSVRRGLFLAESRISLSLWFEAIIILNADQSISDVSLGEALEVQRSTAQRIIK
jgi:hypothetical protein